MNQKELRALKAQSKKWTPREWEEYLQTLEVERSEMLVHPRRYERLKAKNPFLWEKHKKKENLKELSKTIKKALNKLTPKQRKVIKMIFWERLSEREIAKKLGRSPSAIHERKVLSLQRLKEEILALNPSMSPYIGGFLEKTNFSKTLEPLFLVPKETSIFKSSRKGEKDHVA